MTPDDALIDELLEPGIERGVAQHMTDHHQAPGCVGLIQQSHAVAQLRRDGLFQQQMVAEVQRGQRLGHVLAVLCGDNHHIRQARAGQQRLGTVKAQGRVHPILLARGGQALRHGIGYGHDFHKVGVRFLVDGIGIPATVAKPTNGKSNGLIHPLTLL